MQAMLAITLTHTKITKIKVPWWGIPKKILYSFCFLLSHCCVPFHLRCRFRRPQQFKLRTWLLLSPEFVVLKSRKNWQGSQLLEGPLQFCLKSFLNSSSLWWRFQKCSVAVWCHLKIISHFGGICIVWFLSQYLKPKSWPSILSPNPKP